MKISRARRGNTLMIAVALVLVLAALVGALHQYEVVTRRALSSDEADILLVQSRKWEMGKALKKIPAGWDKPADIIVSTGLTAQKQDIYLPDQCAKDLFSRDGDGRWNGLPNLTIERVYRVDPSAAPLPAPPTFREFRGSPTSPNASYQVFKGKTYRHMTGDFLRVAALAPKGSVRLASCSGWANPNWKDLGLKVEERYSGVPVVVAAGTTAKVNKLTYGSIYAGQQVDLVDETSMVIPIVGPLPFSAQMPAQLIEQVETARTALVQTAAQLDNKTTQISGEPPTLSNIIEVIFTDAIAGDTATVLDKMLGWLSVRSAAEFPFVSIPGFSAMAFPGTYFSFQIWFHAPFAPDSEGVTAGVAQAPSQLARDLTNRISQLQVARSTANYVLTEIQGGKVQSGLGKFGAKGRKVYEPSGGYDAEGNPIGEFREVAVQTGEEAAPTPRVAVGLNKRGDALRENLLTDLATLEKARAEGSTTLVTSGLKTDQSLLIWMADYQGYLLTDTGAVPPTGVDSNLGMGVDSLSYDLKATPPSSDADIYRNDVGYPMLNSGLLANSKSVFSPLKDFRGNVVQSGGVNVRDPAVEPTQFFGNVTQSSNQLQAGETITEAQWRTVLDAGKPKQGTMGDLDRQIELLRFLSSTTDANNPFNKVKSLETKLIDQIAALDRKKSDLQSAIELDRAARLTGEKALQGASKKLNTWTKERVPVALPLSTLPPTRKAEREDPKYKTGVYSEFQKGKGLQGYAYWRYGYSFDMLYNVLAYLADSSDTQDSFWTTSVPLVWWGMKENDSPLAAANGLDVKGTFTVPQTRTFYYEHPMTVRGDLWLQRGSTMVVKGDLRVANPFPLPVAQATNYLQALNFLPSGRIFLEEGANLIVLDGSVYSFGPVVVTSQPYAVRPISSSIMAPQGDVFLRHGIFSGLGLTDILQSPDLRDRLQVTRDLQYAVYALTATVFPNIGKVYPLGPFHRRMCHFAKNCTQYKGDIWIGPFGIPVPLIYPWVAPRSNLNVTLHRYLSEVYAVAANVHLGENLYPQCDWWPFRAGENIGVPPILPKLNIEEYALDSGLTALFARFANLDTGAEVGDLVLDGLNQLNPLNSDSVLLTLTNKVLVEAVSKALTQMLPFGLGDAVSQLASALSENSGSETDTAKGPYAAIGGKLSDPFDKLNEKLKNVIGESPTSLENSLMHEVAGALVYGRRIFVGYNSTAMDGGAFTSLPMNSRPLLASGLFLATGDINIHAEYTVGAVISAGGSINADPNSRTNLLFYPGFTRATLYQPGMTPKITNELRNNAGLPTFLARAMDVEYGVMQSGNVGQKGFDVFYADPHVTAEGWEL